MQLLNTLSGKKEPLPQPEKGKPLNLFVCGPTVYDYLHIGNARTYLVFDAFVKYLRSQKKKVFYLQNITDIDDKIIARAAEENKSWDEIAARFDHIYRENMRDLNITAVDEYVPATSHISEIVAQIKTLYEKGYAYTIPDDGIYFDITKFHDYGRLSRRTVVQADDGVSRIDESVNKRNKGDFALWKFVKSTNGHEGNYEPSWKTELGEGRPGWHIEDTAISEKYFGPQYDIHGGGVDLKFPHHEAEIAQQEAASGKNPFVKLWMHVGALSVNGEKMSKSKGNYISIDDFLKKYPADVLRLISLAHHYRSPINYTESLAESYAASWSGIIEFIGRLQFIEKHAIVKHVMPKGPAIFDQAIESDFNTSSAIGEMHKRISALQPKLWRFSKSEARQLAADITSFLKSLGFLLRVPKIPSKIEALAKEREKSRKNKQFIQADALRSEINGLGYSIEDTPLGQFIWPKS